MNRKFGTQNTISQNSTEFGGDVQVWARVGKVAHFGRKVDLSGYSAGDIIPAGTMLIFSSSPVAQIVKATDDDATLAKVNCLSYNDVRVPDGAIFASIAGVEEGKIWAEATDITEEIEAKLTGLHGNIDFLRAMAAE